MRRVLMTTTSVVLLLWTGTWSRAEEPVPTRLLVRAISAGGKILGDHVGGARITVRELDSGKLLASGLQKGGTGDTGKIMGRGSTQAGVVYDTPGAAFYLATLQLAHATRVEVTAEGPLGFPQNIQKTSTTILLVPGQDVLGEGLILTIHGYAMALTAPGEGASAPVGRPLAVRVTVRMACGCPIEPGGIWDADDITVTARLLRAGQLLAESPLAYAGSISTFSGTVTPPSPGPAELEVLAMNPAQANFAQLRTTVHIRNAE